MEYKNVLAACALFALSAVGCAADENGQCGPGRTCGGKPVGPTMNGDRPLIVEPQDSCKGTVKCVNPSRCPKSGRVEMVVETPNGDQKVLMEQKPAVQPGDQVEVSGRNVHVNGQQIMVGQDVKSHGPSNNLNTNVMGQ